MQEKVTIKDIAEATGVSPSTVSRIINHKGKYTQETQQAVWDAIRALKYSPNLMAKTLRSKKSMLVGILVPSINDDYFGALADHLAKTLLSCDFSPVVCATFNENAIEARYCDMLASLNACGMIYILKDTPVQESCQEIPSIFIGSAPELPENGVRILFDIVGGAKEATEELVNAGCRRIVYVASSRHRESQVGRYLGYQQALWENQIPVDESLVVSIGGKEGKTVADALAELLQAGIVFDTLDRVLISTSIEVMNYLKKRGLRIPEDVKVVSFENGKSAELYNPRISAIEMDPSLASESAVSMLRTMIDEGHPVQKVLRIPAVLHRRDTSVQTEE